MKQLRLPISLNTKMLLSNFIGAKNQQILNVINSLFVQKSSAIVFISGTQSSGKTHLLQGCTLAALAVYLNAVYIDIKQQLTDNVIPSLSDFNWICIDNIDYLNDSQQQALFDVYNQIQQTQTKLILSAKRLPNNLNLFKDLKTRLSLATVFNLENLTDEQKVCIIQNQMLDKNININVKIYQYLLNHFSRDLNKIIKVMHTLEQTSLKQKDKMSIAFLKQALKL